MTPLAERLAPVLEQISAENRTEDTAATRAASEPLPGPLKVAFATVTGIQAGKWTVRRMCDWDYETLCEVKHPFANELRSFMVKAGLDEATAEEGEKFRPRGPAMWQLAWWFTRPSAEVEKVIRTGNAWKNDAADEFGQCRLLDYKQILEAIYSQVEVYWSTNLGYEPVGNGESAKANPDPTQSSVAELTASGSSINGAG